MPRDRSVRSSFSWLDGWTQLVDERTERSRGMTLELSNWFWEGVLMKGGVLSIDRAYFDITGGRERWLYKVARKHAGGAGEGGFAISMPTLFEKSGAEGEYRRFKFEILKLVERNGLPGYDLILEVAQNGGEPAIRMRRNDSKLDATIGIVAEQVQHSDPAKVSSRKLPERHNSETVQKAVEAPPSEPLFDASKLIRKSVAGLSDAANRGFIADETITLLRNECPGWDLYALHADFETWVAGSAERTPANWQRAFIGWVRRHHEKHRHELRGI